MFSKYIDIGKYRFTAVVTRQRQIRRLGVMYINGISYNRVEIDLYITTIDLLVHRRI